MTEQDRNEKATTFFCEPLNRDLVQYEYVYFPPWSKTSALISNGVRFMTVGHSIGICRARRDAWVRDLRETQGK